MNAELIAALLTAAGSISGSVFVFIRKNGQTDERLNNLVKVASESKTLIDNLEKRAIERDSLISRLQSEIEIIKRDQDRNERSIETKLDVGIRCLTEKIEEIKRWQDGFIREFYTGKWIELVGKVESLESQIEAVRSLAERDAGR